MTQKSTTPKIMHIIAGAATGGAETFCMDAIRALHEKGVDQYVICRAHPNFTNALKALSIPHTTLSFSRWKKIFEIPTIRKIITQHKPDMIHAWMNRAATFTPANLPMPVLGWFGGYYDLKNYKNCDYYMGVTRDIVRHIGEKSGAPERTFLVHTFGTLPKDTPVKKSDFGIPENAKTILLLSRMHWKKGVDTLLQAAVKIPDVYLLLAGDGPKLQEYKTLAQTLNLSDRAKFLGWRTDRAALLAIADVCCLPSRYEPFGTVIAESWYAGIPLVATRADGARQYVTHRFNGLLSDIDDVDTLAENLKSALFDTSLRAALIENGKQTYADTFSQDVVTQSLLDAYTSIIKSGKRT